MSPTPRSCWLFIVDHRSGRLVRCQPSSGRAHFDEVARLENEWPVHEHEQPTSLSGLSSHGYASLPHETEEQRRRFAKTAATWLAKHAESQHIEQVTVVAPGHLLGALRKAWPARLTKHIAEVEGELSALTSSELALHPLIARVVAGQASG